MRTADAMGLPRARKRVRRCGRRPLSATDARGTEHRSDPRPTFASRCLQRPSETAGTFAANMVSGHPGDRSIGQGFSLFINTLKFNRLGIMLASD